MRYIEKHFDTDAVVSHEQELANRHLDEESLRRPEVHPGRTGGQLYETVRNMPTMHALKEQMYAEQGGVCCYCGMNLDYPFNPQYRVEHVLPNITLGLAGKYLTDRRRAAIDSLIMADGVLTDDDLMAYREGLKKPNADGKYAEFYFVLIDAINQLLPGN